MMERHPLSGLWPDMAPEEYEALIDDIAANGVQQAVVTYEGQILDGWHRYQAATLLGIMPPVRPYTGDDPARFVISANAMRRQLSSTQRAAAVQSCLDWRRKGAQPVDETDEGSANLHTPPSAQEVAQVAGVSPRTVADVRKGIEGGYGDAMIKGEVKAYEAADATRAQERGEEPVYRISPMERLRAELTVAANELLAARTERDALQQELAFLKGQISEYPHEREALFNNLRAEVSELRASRDSLMVELRDLKVAHRAAMRHIKALEEGKA